MERAGNDRAGINRAARYTCADDADGQAHQRRFPDGGLDPAGQHHGAGTGHGAAAPAASVFTGECTDAVRALGPDGSRRPRAGRGQEAGGVEIIARRRTGPACARSAGSRRRE